MKFNQTLVYVIALIAGGLVLGGCTFKNPFTGEIIDIPGLGSVQGVSTDNSNPKTLDGQLGQLDEDLKEIEQLNKEVIDGIYDKQIDLNTY